MPVNYPKFDQKIQNQIDLSLMKAPKTRLGMILTFDKQNNTARIMLDRQHSDNIGSVIDNVPCPVSKGVQSVSPTIGTRCLVGFHFNNETSPYVLSYFEDTRLNSGYMINYTVDTGIPKFLVH